MQGVSNTFGHSWEKKRHYMILHGKIAQCLHLLFITLWYDHHPSLDILTLTWKSPHQRQKNKRDSCWSLAYRIPKILVIRLFTTRTTTSSSLTLFCVLCFSSRTPVLFPAHAFPPYYRLQTCAAPLGSSSRYSQFCVTSYPFINPFPFRHLIIVVIMFNLTLTRIATV